MLGRNLFKGVRKFVFFRIDFVFELIGCLEIGQALQGVILAYFIDVFRAGWMSECDFIRAIGTMTVRTIIIVPNRIHGMHHQLVVINLP